MSTLINRTFSELDVGDTVAATRELRPADLRAWTNAFDEAAPGTPSGDSQGAAGIVTALLTALAGASLPGPGTEIRSVSVSVLGALRPGATLTSRLTVREKRAGDGTVALDGHCTDDAGTAVATAVLEVQAPTERRRREVAEHRLDALIDRCTSLAPPPTGVVHPCDATSLSGALEAARAGLIEPVLYGPAGLIRQVADGAGLDIEGSTIVSTSDADDSAAKAALAAGAGEVAALMKGDLHTDVLLHAVLDKRSGLRTGRLLSHCAILSVPTYARRVLLTDAALNIAPDTDAKRDLCQNAIGCARALGIDVPKVAVLAAVETVRTRMPATLDGAILAKMADRRQIVGGIVDGPLDLDAAVDAEAARIKRIDSPVAGAADVLLAPNIEAGNLVYKNLGFMADAQSAGVVVGARVPIVLTSRADTAAARRFSAAAAVLYAEASRRDPSILHPEPAA